MLVIRAFGNEKHSEDRCDKANKDVTNLNLFVNRSMASIMPIMMFIFNVDVYKRQDLQIDGLDRTNLLNDIITVLGQMKINILNIHADASDDGKALIKLKIGVDDAEHLNRAIANLERIQGIYEIKRVIH